MDLDIKMSLIFADFKVILVQQFPTRRKAWASQENKPEGVAIKNGRGFTLMVFTSVGYNYKGKLIIVADKSVFVRGPRKGKLKLIPKTEDQNVYQNEILLPLFEDFKTKGMAIDLGDGKGRLVDGFTYQQDGAPTHCTSGSMEFLDKIFGLENVMSRHNKSWKGKKPKIIWPPRSPDLSPLDFSIWKELKELAMSKAPLGYYENPEQAADLLVEAWSEIDQSYINKCCVQGYRNRLERCLANGGSYSGKRRARENREQ